MGIKSISFLVSTRIIAGMVVIVPLYAMAIILSFLSAQVVTTLFYGQSIGTYEHYFRTFLRPEDVGWSMLEAIVIASAVMLTHCYYGYTASGGPVGVGLAVGKSMRFSLVAVQLVVLLASLALYGADPNLQPHGVAAVTVTTLAKENQQPTKPYKVVGAIFFVVAAVVCFVVYRGFRGEFADNTDLTMLMARSGLVLDPGSKVTYNGVKSAVCQ